MCMYNGNGMTWRPLESYGGGDLETMRMWLETDGVVPGISDAGAHLSIFQDGVAPAFFLTHWARDRVRGPKMTLEKVIMMQCRDTAHAIGLLDRGTLDVGMKADLNIIDWEQLKINMPYYTNDLPAGAPRWMQTVSGFKRTSTSQQSLYSWPVICIAARAAFSRVYCFMTADNCVLCRFIWWLQW